MIFKILWLKASVRNLKRKRRSAILDISMNQPKEVNCANKIEDVNPLYFKSIDYSIQVRERLILRLFNKLLYGFSSINETKI